MTTEETRIRIMATIESEHYDAQARAGASIGLGLTAIAEAINNLAGVIIASGHTNSIETAKKMTRYFNKGE